MNNLRFFYSPDAPGSASSSSDASVHKTPGLPVKDADFMDVAKAVAKSWVAHPSITLAYFDSGSFSNLVALCAAKLDERLATGANRPLLTQTLAQLDDSIDDAITEVKVYLQKKYKKDNAPAHYAAFGLEKQNHVFQLPRDRNKRLQALKQTKAAIETEGFGNEEYGTDFWNNVYDAYSTAMTKASDTDGQITAHVSGKNSDKEQIKKIMISLRKVLEGNFPDTYEDVYRVWGWQKEHY
ncbi:hypothetical protein [Ferruginibacter albus]|uniref:hypothetical protein n=1 Tax=Ferruginibacter albus TaxID=2875540 RepID=UPI001CC66F00|nr:hypothetical protein [Ferruginibacter albus]UAY51765.1 hypothetical protein K9M53_14360 [Ferruginibacter albus]